MRPRRHLLPLLAILAPLGSVSRASEEEFVPWRSLRLDCEELPQTGKVGISAAVNGDRFSACEVTAFGKAHKLAANELDKLRGFPLNDLRITHEAGYPELGGHTVHFKFRRATYAAREKKTIVEEVIVSVSRGKGLAVTGPTRRE